MEWGGASGVSEDWGFPDGEGGFDEAEVFGDEREGGRAVAGGAGDEEGRFAVRDETGAVVDDDAVGAEGGGDGEVDALEFREGHGIVAGVGDAGDGLVVFGVADAAEEDEFSAGGAVVPAVRDGDGERRDGELGVRVHEWRPSDWVEKAGSAWPSWW